jgi:hypothetical protein
VVEQTAGPESAVSQPLTIGTCDTAGTDRGGIFGRYDDADGVSDSERFVPRDHRRNAHRRDQHRCLRKHHRDRQCDA